MDYSTDLVHHLLAMVLMTSLVQAAVETINSMGNVGATKEMCALAGKAAAKNSLTAYVTIKGSPTTTKIAITFSLTGCASADSLKVESCTLAEGNRDFFHTGLTPFLFKGQKHAIECLKSAGARIRTIDPLAPLAKMGQAGAALELCNGRRDDDLSVITDVTVTGSPPKIRIPIVFNINCRPVSPEVSLCFYWNGESRDIEAALPNIASDNAVFEHDGKTYKLTCNKDQGAVISNKK